MIILGFEVKINFNKKALLSYNLCLILIITLISKIKIINSQELYESMNDIPNNKKGFSAFLLGLSPGCRPLYFVDINGDKLNDIIAACKIANGGTKINYFVYDEQNKQFVLSNNSTITLENEEIISFVANDFNKDGFLDYIITVKTKENNQNYEGRLYLYNSETKEFKLSWSLKNQSTSNLFVADLGSQRGLKILYFNSETKKREILFYNEIESKLMTQDFSTLLSNNTILCDGNTKYSNLPFNSINSNGFIDINGDCINDILIESIENSNRNLEIWLGVFENNEIKYCLSTKNVYKLNKILGLFSLFDLDRNTLVDLAFPILNSSPPKIAIAYNKLSLTYDWTSDFCTDHLPIDLSSNTASNYEISAIFENLEKLESSENLKIIQIFDNADYSFYDSDTLYPLYLRFQNINQDSYPDLLTILINKKTNKKYPYVFLSSDSSSSSNSEKRIYNNANSYNLNEYYNFENYDISVITFFDFGDDSKLDLLFTDTKFSTVIGLYNQNIYDAYSLKSILLSKTGCFFCNEFGSTQRFITTNIDGTRRMDLSIQCPQISLQGNLSPTYAYLGIGRSNNYLENFHVISGNAYKRTDNDQTYTPVIPNSQLIIYHNNVYGSNSTTWNVDLVVTPTKNLNKLIFIIIILITIFTFYTSYLQMKERQEDENENKETFAPWFG